RSGAVELQPGLQLQSVRVAGPAGQRRRTRARRAGRLAVRQAQRHGERAGDGQSRQHASLHLHLPPLDAGCDQSHLTEQPLRGPAPRLLDLDENALPGALLGGLDDRLLEVAGHVCQSLDATGVTEDLAAFLDVGEAVVEEGEDVGTDLLAQAVARAEVLVDPHLHCHAALVPSWRSLPDGDRIDRPLYLSIYPDWTRKTHRSEYGASSSNECHWCTLPTDLGGGGRGRQHGVRTPLGRLRAG